ncbi:hypothetical protein DW082_08085 [Alistipes sp. AF48-12]|nr:hypothetical protein DW082_08085 [Alistipes sp. AF48-12]
MLPIYLNGRFRRAIRFFPEFNSVNSGQNVTLHDTGKRMRRIRGKPAYIGRADGPERSGRDYGGQGVLSERKNGYYCNGRKPYI